jgi:hypothetical protein
MNAFKGHSLQTVRASVLLLSKASFVAIPFEKGERKPKPYGQGLGNNHRTCERDLQYQMQRYLLIPDKTSISHVPSADLHIY